MTTIKMIRSRRFALVASLLITLAACSDDAELVGYEQTPTPHVGDLTLEQTGSGNSETAVKAASGQLLVAFIGFTNCPDACPTALAEIGAALDRLGESAKAIDVAMITVDPERDTSDILEGYVQSVVPGGFGLRTDDPALLQEVIDAFGATAAVEHEHDGEVSVGHTDHTYLIDDNGDVVVTWTAEMNTDDLVNDLEIFLSQLPSGT